MKRYINSKLILFMVMIFIVPFVWNMDRAVAAATTPSLVQTNLKMTGTGVTFDLNIKNKISKSSYKWTSSDKNIATVTKKGIVTSVGPGTAKIKCKITYPSKKTKTLTCTVTVTVPATDIQISNATLSDGVQKMIINDTLDLDCTLTPANATDQVFWSVEKGNADCVRIDDAAAGKITALKEGTVIIKASATTTATAEAADKSIIYDSVIIEVVAPKATVTSASITDSNTIKIIFDSAVNPGTVINTDGTLSANIQITQGKDAKKVLADDPGKLTASLSTDGKILTITTGNALKGNYGINWTNSIMTTSGVALDSDSKLVSYIDTVPPYCIGTTIDDTGFVNVISFTEPMNFTNIMISEPKLVAYSTTEGASSSTISLLQNKLNYIVSADKKSLSINLSYIAAADYNKKFNVNISGITDTAGNPPASVYFPVTLSVDTTQKPQANIISIERTSYNVVTVTYTRAIQSNQPGTLQIGNDVAITGKVDLTNKNKVNYEMMPAQTAYTGLQTVKVGYWNSYNVLPTDTTANTYHTRSVNFSADMTSPNLVSNSYDIGTGILTLTYNENVTLTNSTGTIGSIYRSTTEEVKSTNLPYTKVTHTDGDNIIKLQMTNLSLAGNYEFSIPAGFVRDAFNNESVARLVTLTNSTSSSSTELPPPYTIYQDTANLSQVYVKFANMVDLTSAQTVSNYTIAGLQIVSARVTDNSTATGATVILTVADGTNTVEAARPITVKGVKGSNNSYTPISLYTTTIILKENAKPLFSGAAFDKTMNRIILTFNEAVTGTVTVNTSLIYNSTTTTITNNVTVSGNYVYINLYTIPMYGSSLRIDVVSVALADATGNTMTVLPSPIMISAGY